MQDNNKVQILLGVWGERFINDFFSISLPSLLAPGNIPTLVKEYPTKFVFLTRSCDIETFESSPALQRLKKICEVDYICINDMIVIGNYSTTLTLAYDRAIKQVGTAMLNTYFVFLTSDYIMADGSFAGLVRYMRQGYSGICAGNFQVLEEKIKEKLEKLIDPQTRVMQINARELLKLSLPHLHPITTASFLDQPMTHNNHANRFFVRTDSTTIAGRFYLLHMLCIKPERMDYRVGASCDYSFIPEMCPSGNVAIIDDSDDYFVVEMQLKQHELGFIKTGGYRTKTLARSLSEWTTATHRQNAKKTIYYHVQDLSVEKKQETDKRLEDYLSPVVRCLNKYKVKPVYSHPYWVGAFHSYNTQKGIYDVSSARYRDIVLDSAGTMKKYYFCIVGRPPKVFPWHYRFLEYRATMKLLKEQLQKADYSVTALYASYQYSFMHLSDWLKTNLQVDEHHHAPTLQRLPDEIKRLAVKQSDACIYFADFSDLDRVVKSLSMVKKIMKPKSKLLLFIPNDRNHYPKMFYDLEAEFAFKAHAFNYLNYQVVDIRSIRSNLTFWGSLLRAKIDTSFDKKSHVILAYLLLGIPGCLLSFVRNCLPVVNKKQGHCTGILVTLQCVDESKSL